MVAENIRRYGEHASLTTQRATNGDNTETNLPENQQGDSDRDDDFDLANQNSANQINLYSLVIEGGEAKNINYYQLNVFKSKLLV